MALKSEDFENFPNATTFNTANAGTFGKVTYANVASNANTFATTTADAAHGTSCLGITGVSATAGQFDIPDTAAAAGAVSFYFKILSTPSVTTQFPIGWRQSAGALGRLEMSTTRQLRINMTGIGTFGTALALSTWYRIEIVVTGTGTAATAATMNAYVGDATGTAFATDTVTGQTTAAQMDRFRYYRFSTEATALDCRIDSIQQNIGASSQIGPWPATTTKAKLLRGRPRLAAIQAANR
jgi:hypothetical protein